MVEHDDDAESSRSGSAAPEPKGKQTSSQLRKAQNRLAQREFRQRKQQYIRDLEARVEVLSQGEDERAGLGLLLVKNLLKENKELRALLKAMAGFIGEGAGSFLPRLGLSAEQLDDILNRADTDTAHEAFLALKVPKEVEEANPGLPIGEIRRPAAGKRKRGSVDADESPLAGPSRPAAADEPRLEPRDAFDSYDLVLGQAGSPAFPSPSAAALSGFGLTVPPATPRSPLPLPSPDFAVDPAHTEQQRSSLRAAVAHITSLHPPAIVEQQPMSPAQLAERQDAQAHILRNMQDTGAAERKTEAMQLVSYHLNNFRMNHEYRLPPSLRPTAVQRTIPHEHAIDGVIFPSIRNRMILLRGRYDLVEAFQRYIDDLTIHGDNTLDHNNWEVSESWLDDFRMLVDDEVYAVTNKWRTLRGLPALVPPTTRVPDPYMPM